ncbi:FecCD family ABC transporter permease [Salibacterium halotolerans]|uniref:Iron complex transport system permease protein n=1 Tax=Salibacterium halotolerans TaxID=1884432 RepID=A0A1I5V6W2_9BACI|nr:iron ABC transporter permease [Salibacterium halotolerans]SFQ03259.1 iron complex transport system permease protein [Salibacterium halotolerans]
MADHEKEQPDAVKNKNKQGPAAAVLILVFGTLALIISLAVSITFGAASIKLTTVWEALFAFNPDLSDHQVIQEIRLPRVLSAVFVGSFLAVSGAIMQGMTRNPLASPAILGVSDGAAFAIAIAFAFFPGTSYVGLMGWSFAGAGLGALLVFGVGMFSKGGITPAKLALAGVAVGAMLSSFSTAIAIQFDVAQDMTFWFAGGLAGIEWTSIQMLLPVAVVGLGIAFLISRAVTILSLGEEVSRGLGQRTTLIKVLGIITVLLLTGAAVAVAGRIGFIGLVIPHITRFLAGMDYRWLIPCSAVLGALLLVLSDLGARMVNAPYETPVGAITALIGIPFFLYLARGEGRGL